MASKTGLATGPRLPTGRKDPAGGKLGRRGVEGQGGAVVKAWGRARLMHLPGPIGVDGRTPIRQSMPHERCARLRTERRFGANLAFAPRL